MTPNHFSSPENALPDRNTRGPEPAGEVFPRPEAIYLKPGEMFTGCEAARITTVLGSCVAVTMYDPRRHAAAICHAIQPVCRSATANCLTGCGEKFKPVRCAVEEMVLRMDQMGVSHDELEVKIFGGAALLGERKSGDKIKSVGEQNIEAARRVLAEYGFSIRAMEVGGTVGRKIIFHTRDGAVFLKRIVSIRANRIFSADASFG